MTGPAESKTMSRPDWSGRIEARIGLRMMPTFPRSSPIIPYSGFSPVRLEGWHIRRDLPEASISLSLLPRDPTPRAGRA